MRLEGVATEQPAGGSHAPEFLRCRRKYHTPPGKAASPILDANTFTQL